MDVVATVEGVSGKARLEILKPVALDTGSASIDAVVTEKGKNPMGTAEAIVGV